MYGHFIQFTIPKIGQALVAVVLYLNFLKLPFVACFAGAYPAVYLLLPLLLLLLLLLLSPSLLLLLLSPRRRLLNSSVIEQMKVRTVFDRPDFFYIFEDFILHGQRHKLYKTRHQ